MNEQVEQVLVASPVTVKRYVSVKLDVDGKGAIEESVVMRAGRRVFYFDSWDTLVTALGDGSFAPTRSSLGSAEGFAARLSQATGRADLVVLTHDDDERSAPWSLYELDVASDHLETRWRIAVPPRPEDQRGGVARARETPPAAALAPGAAVTFAAADARAILRDLTLDALPAAGPGLGPPPPLWVARTAEDWAFGWYPRATGTLWNDWLVAARWDAKLEAAWHARRYPAMAADGVPATIEEHVLAVRRGRLLLLGTDSALLVAAGERISTTNDTGPTSRFHATFDGPKAAAAFSRLASPTGNIGRDVGLGMLAILSGSVARAETDAV